MIPPLLALAGALAGAWLLARQVYLRRRLGELAEAVEQRKPWLLEAPDGLASVFGFPRLERAFRELMAESDRRSRSAKDSLQQVEATLRNLQEAVLLLDADNSILLANEALRPLLMPGRDAIGQKVEAVVPSAGFLECVRIVRQGSPVVRREVEVARGRESLWFEVTGALVPDAGPPGRPSAIFVLHDITRLKRLERVRSEFVANVSHELRTPVTIIKGFTDTLIEDHGRLDEEGRARFLGKIQRHTSRLESLLEDLLTLTRLEAGTEPDRRERLDLRAALATIVEDFQVRRDAVRLRFETVLGDAPVEVMADPVRVSQIVENLLDNALRHAKGATRVTVSLAVAAAEAELRVADDGAGIPEADLPHVFARFYRVDKGRSRESGGTGLGLSIVKHLVQAHGGQVRVESRVGEGTTFAITLPLARAAG